MILPFVGLAWIVGMAAVAAWQASPWIASAWFFLLSPVGWAWGPRGWGWMLALAGLAALAGGLRLQAWEERPAPALAAEVGSTVEVRGVIRSEPDPGTTTTRYRLETSEIRSEGAWKPTGGGVLLTLGQYRDLEVGASLIARGPLDSAPVYPDFDYRGYLAREGIVGTMLFPQVETTGTASRWDIARLLSELRLTLDGALQRSLPEPAASLGGGIAFGRDGNLAQAVYDDFRRTGLAHIVAVSGSNVTLVTAMTFIALRPFVGRKRALLPASVAVLGYLALTGFTPSVLRAGVMAGVYLGGIALGRPQSALPALALAAITMTAWDPGLARDVGFQLSLSATGGLIVFGPWIRWSLESGIRRTWLRAWAPRGALDVASISLAATAATLPIVWVNFGQMSLIGPLANLVVAPLFALAFWLSLSTAVAGALWEPAGLVAGLAAYYPLATMLWLAATLADVPAAAIELPAAGATTAAAAFALMTFAGFPAYRYLAPATGWFEYPGPGKTVRRAAWGAAGGGLAAAVTVVSVLPLRGPGQLEIAVLDVGQGDAILVSTPGGKRVLVDGGPSGIELARELGAVLPHWERKIDRVILTHPHADHVGGLPELSARFDIARIAEGTGGSETELYAELQEREPDRELLAQGDVFELDDVRFEVLWPPVEYAARDSNNLSLVLSVTYGDVYVLLAGDIEAGPQRELLASLSRVDVLKVPHHGSATSDRSFLSGLGAQVAVISVGEDNRFGHPAGATLTALAGLDVYRTDEDGRVVVRSDGESVTVDTER